MTFDVSGRTYTPEEYLEIERVAEFKSLYLDGRIIAVAGGREAHNLIATNIAGAAYAQFKGKPFRVYTSNMRVQVGASQRFLYPDVVVVAEPAEFRDELSDTLLNPVVAFEIFTSTTERSDRGWKAESYRMIPSLQEIVIISQDRVHVEHYVRNGEKWTFEEFSTEEEQLELPAVAATLTIAEIYERVTLPAADEARDILLK